MNQPLRRFWVSWYSPRTLGSFEISSPWWISGERPSDGSVMVVCAVRAVDEASARRVVLASYDAPPTDLDWRFCDLRADDWSPFCDRFPRADWMVWP